VYRQSIRTGRRFEIDIQAPIEPRRSLPVDLPNAGPVALQSDLVHAQNRSRDDMRRARHPPIIEGEVVADRPRVVLLDRGRMPLQPEAGAVVTNEENLEAKASVAVAPSRRRWKLEHVEPRGSEELVLAAEDGGHGIVLEHVHDRLREERPNGEDGHVRGLLDRVDRDRVGDHDAGDIGLPEPLEAVVVEKRVGDRQPDL
jgi:hypothetical protein